jgi:hypothetical protein
MHNPRKIPHSALPCAALVFRLTPFSSSLKFFKLTPDGKSLVFASAGAATGFVGYKLPLGKPSRASRHSSPKLRPQRTASPPTAKARTPFSSARAASRR